MKRLNKKSKGKWVDASTWKRLIEAYGSSGLSVKDFCASQGVSAASYYRWHHRLKEAKEAGSSLFRPIEIQSKVRGVMVGGIEVELPGGVIMRFEELPPVDYVRNLSLTFSGGNI